MAGRTKSHKRTEEKLHFHLSGARHAACQMCQLSLESLTALLAARVLQMARHAANRGDPDIFDLSLRSSLERRLNRLTVLKTPESGSSSCGSRRGKCWHLCVDDALHHLTSKLDCAAASMHVGGCLAGCSCEDIPPVLARKVCGAADHVSAPSWLRTAGVALCTHRLCTWRYSMT